MQLIISKKFFFLKKCFYNVLFFQSFLLTEKFKSLWYDAQHKVREILPEESKLFVKEIFKALYEQQTQLFCGQITDGCEECQSLVFDDKPPSRPLYKNWMTHVLELILQFA
jgi:hypothetical protein